MQVLSTNNFPPSLLIKEGGQLLSNTHALIEGYGEDYTAVVTDPGSQWAGIGQLIIGNNYGDHLLISNSAVVQAFQAIVGNSIAPCNTVTVVNGGAFIVTNNLANASLTLPSGYIFLSDGTVIGNNISISNQSEIAGCGTIIGNVNNSGTLSVNCPGGTLTLDGILTNNSSIIATNGADIEFLGPVVNNGTVDLVNGFGHFLGGFLNKGVYRDAGTVLKTPALNFTTIGMVISFGSVSGKTYAVEYTDCLTPTNWSVLFGGITGTGGTMQFTDTSAVGLTQRFYRVHLTMP